YPVRGTSRVSRKLRPFLRPLDCAERTRHPALPCKSEEVFQSELYQPRIPRLANFPIGGTVIAIAGVAAWVQKLGVIKGVEELCAELNVCSLCDWRALMEGERPILDSGPAANGGRSVAQLAELHGSVGKGVGIKIQPPILARIQMVKWKCLIGLAGEFEREGV